MNTYRIMPLLALLALPCRADVFVFNGLTPHASFEQLPNEPGGQLLDKQPVLGTDAFCQLGECDIPGVAPLDSSFSIQNPSFNFLPILNPKVNPPAGNALLVVDSHTLNVCLPAPCYFVLFTLGPTSSALPGIVETGQLQTAPFSVIWSNGTTTYTDTFEFQVSDGAFPTPTPEPKRAPMLIGIAVLILGIARISRTVA